MEVYRRILALPNVAEYAFESIVVIYLFICDTTPQVSERIARLTVS